MAARSTLWPVRSSTQVAPLRQSAGPSSSAPCRVRISMTRAMTAPWLHSTLLSGMTRSQARIGSTSCVGAKLSSCSTSSS